MKSLALFFLFFSVSFSSAYAQADSLQRQINQQVWKPFLQSFSGDPDTFMSVHSKSLARVLQDDNRIQTYEEYYASNKQGEERRRKMNMKPATLQLRFTQRVAENGKALEVGYYKTTVVTPDGPRSFYGKFHVLLQKEKGVWKIVMDADAREDANEQTFMNAKPME